MAGRSSITIKSTKKVWNIDYLRKAYICKGIHLKFFYCQTGLVNIIFFSKCFDFLSFYSLFSHNLEIFRVPKPRNFWSCHSSCFSSILSLNGLQHPLVALWVRLHPFHDSVRSSMRVWNPLEWSHSRNSIFPLCTRLPQKWKQAHRLCYKPRRRCAFVGREEN